MIGVEDVMTTFAPSTASRPTRTPSTTMHREPTNAPSSTITGLAWRGSSTPPIPTPPERWTSVPICAHEPPVAHVSTIVPEPTHAPTLTYDGMSTTPGAMYAPWRAVAGGTTRTPFSAQPVLSGILSWYSYGPTSIVSIPRVRNESRIAFFAHSLTCQPSPAGAATRISPSSSIVMTCSTVWAASSSRSDVARSKSSSMRADRAVRSVVDMPGRLEGGEKLRRAAALVERRDERGADVPLAARPEEGPGGDDDPELVEEPQGERLGVVGVGGPDSQPEEEARVAAAALEA